MSVATNPQPANLMAAAIFTPGNHPSPGPQAGKSYPAYMYDLRRLEPGPADGPYGPSVKIKYALIIGAGTANPRIAEMQELATVTDAVNGKLVGRACLVNGMTPDESVDLGSLDTYEGWVLVTLEKDRKDERYNRIGNVTALPDGIVTPMIELRQDQEGYDYAVIVGSQPSLVSAAPKRLDQHGGRNGYYIPDATEADSADSRAIGKAELDALDEVPF